MDQRMKVLITGSNGQLGTDLVARCEAAGDTITAVDLADLDITDTNSVSQILRAVAPDVLFNCAAFTAVDACESNAEQAELVNATAVGYLAEHAAAVGAHLVQVSTDYVFSGSKVGAYLESDQPDPQSVYGRTKLAGEVAATPAATVVRTSWLCSAHGGNMVATILNAIQAHPTLSFVTDQVGRPTFSADLAAAMHNLATERLAGTFHVANHGVVSWFGFTQAVLRAAGLDPERVLPILTADLDPPRPAPRPPNSELDTAKYESLGFGELRHFEEPLAEVVPAYC